MHSKAIRLEGSYFSPESINHFIRMVHSATECALMRAYAQKKITAQSRRRITINTWNFRSEIERALDAITTTDIEKIWHLGNEVIDEIINNLLEQLPDILFSEKTLHRTHNSYRVTTPAKFSSLLIYRLMNRIHGGQ